MRIKEVLRGVFFLLLLSSCQKETVTSPQEYFRWMNDEENGLVRTRYVNGLEVKVKYLPPQYLAYQELENLESYTPYQKDSIMDQYKSNLAFVMSIGSDERKEEGIDIMYKNVRDYREYAERTYNMNFEMEEFITLSADGKEYSPVLSAMENIYGLDSKRNILFVFAPNGKSDHTFQEAEKLDFIYKDELFDLGTNHFVFKKEAIQSVPEFPFADTVK